MRITTSLAYDQSVENLQKRQQDLTTSQTQLTSGKRVNKASDDPTAAARAERALAAIGRSDAEQRAIDASRNVMNIAESALGDGVELLQSARETLVALGNGGYSDSDRRALTAKLSEIRKQLLSVANRPDGGGGYVFGGQSAANAPFIEVPNPDPATAATLPSTVKFTGQAGQTQAATREAVNLSVDGQRTWLQGRDSSGALVDVNIFDTLTKAINTLGANVSPGTTTVKDAVTAGLGDLDKILGNMQSARAEVGEALNRMDGIESRNSALKLAAKTEKSNAEDLDMTEAISEFTNRHSGYQAALQSYASIQKLSLFQYIG